MIAQSFEEFQEAAGLIYSECSNPESVRFTFKYNHSKSHFEAAVTDNFARVSYKADSIQEFKKLEKFIQKIFTYTTSKDDKLVFARI